MKLIVASNKPRRGMYHIRTRTAHTLPPSLPVPGQSQTQAAAAAAVSAAWCYHLSMLLLVLFSPATGNAATV